MNLFKIHLILKIIISYSLQLSLINSLKLKPETWNGDQKTLDHTRKKN
jgi:hypothetical protein